MNEQNSAPQEQEPTPAPAAPAPELPNVQGYEVLGLLGEGETGVVWRAVQEETGREVALKLLKADVFGNDEARQRFERDSTIAAQLHHPNITRLYEVAREGDVYCYAAELIEGRPLDEYVREHDLSSPDALWLMWMVCEAVQHAQQHGLIHGNLKPANILVSADGEPHVLDFALDRAYWTSEAAAQTAADERVVAGLPVFLAPEALAGDRDEIDSRADVYSLGALLLWLLTGESSYDEATGEPRIVDSADAELQALLRQALAADREQRYASAGDLGADLTRYLQDQPLSAMPATSSYLFRKTVRRNRAWLTVAVSALVLVVAMLLYAQLRRRQDREEARASAARLESDRQRAERALETARTELAAERVAQAEPVKPAVPPEEERIRAAQAAAQQQAADTNHRLLRQAAEQLSAGAFDDAAATLWSVPADDRQWEWGRLLTLCYRDLWTFRTDDGAVHALALSEDGRWLVTGGNTGARFWNTTDGRGSLQMRAPAPVRKLALNLTGRRVLGACGDGSIRLWEAAAGRELFAVKNLTQPLAIAFGADDSLLAIAGEDSGLHAFDPISRRETGRLPLGGPATCAAFSPNRARIATGHADGRVVIWETAQGRRLWEFRAFPSAATAVAFTPDSRVVLAAGANLTMRSFDVEGRELLTLRANHEQPIEAIAFTSDGARMLTVGRDRLAQLREYPGGAEINTFRGHAGGLTAAVFLPDNRRAITAALDGTARLWRADKPEDILPCKDDATCTRTFANLTTLKQPPIRQLTRADNGLWHVAENGDKVVAVLTELPAEVAAITLTADGQRVIAAGRNEPARVWDANTGKPGLALGFDLKCLTQLGPSPLPRRVIARACDQTLRFWDAADPNQTEEQFQQQRRAALANRGSR